MIVVSNTSPISNPIVLMLNNRDLSQSSSQFSIGRSTKLAFELVKRSMTGRSKKWESEAQFGRPSILMKRLTN